jgi:hypothetical protein
MLRIIKPPAASFSVIATAKHAMAIVGLGTLIVMLLIFSLFAHDDRARLSS